MDMRLFFVDPNQLAEPLVTIQGSEAHHIKNVLRLKAGNTIKLFDGTGFVYEATIIKLSANMVQVEVQHKSKAAMNEGVQIIVGQAYLKERKMDDLVRKLCELGVSHWIPFFSQRSIPRPDERKLTARSQRWRRIATEAVKQCRRINALQIGEAQSFEDVLAFGESCDLKLVFWENESKPLCVDVASNSEQPIRKILLVLGPEGGFTEQEIQMMVNSGFVVAGLGPRILKAETATLAACTLVQFLFGDMGKKILTKVRA